MIRSAVRRVTDPRTGFQDQTRIEFFLIESNFYLENEMFVEDGLQCVSENFSFTCFRFVRQDVNFDVRIRASPQVHGLQTICFFDPHYELEGKQRTVVDEYGERSAGSSMIKTWLTLLKKFLCYTQLTQLYRTICFSLI